MNQIIKELIIDEIESKVDDIMVDPGYGEDGREDWDININFELGRYTIFAVGHAIAIFNKKPGNWLQPPEKTYLQRKAYIDYIIYHDEIGHKVCEDSVTFNL